MHLLEFAGFAINVGNVLRLHLDSGKGVVEEPFDLMLTKLPDRPGFGLMSVSPWLCGTVVQEIRPPEASQWSLRADWLIDNWSGLLDGTPLAEFNWLTAERIEVLDHNLFRIVNFEAPDFPAIERAKDIMLGLQSGPVVKKLLALQRGVFVHLEQLINTGEVGLRNIRLSWNTLPGTEYAVGIMIFDPDSFEYSLVAHTEHFFAKIGIDASAYSRPA